jgi:hypothetical protein
MYRKEKESQVVRRVKGSDHMSHSAQLSHVSRLIAWAGVTCCGMYIKVTPRFGYDSHKVVHGAKHIRTHTCFVLLSHTHI